MYRAFLLIVVQLFWLPDVVAQSHIDGAVYPAHIGLSPISFDDIATPSDTFIVTDQGADNDDYRYRDDNKEYDFSFELPIQRYVGNIPKLLESGLISAVAKIYVPAFDVDQTEGLKDCDEDGIPDKMRSEIDEVYFNGRKIGELSGSDNVWDIQGNIFEVPIEQVNFPSTPGEEAHNVLQVRIDVANVATPLSSGKVGCQMWGTEIDYVAMQFDVADPIALVVGLGGKPDAFEDANYLSFIEDKGLPAFIVTHSPTAPPQSCALDDATSFPVHGREIIEQLIAKSEIYKSKSFNIISHSKGGLDSRYAIDWLRKYFAMTTVGTLDGINVYNPIQIHSLTMIGTPNSGTILADALNYDLYLGKLSSVADLIPSLRDYCDLSPSRVARFTSRVRIPEDVNTLLIGANADENGDGKIDYRESEFNQLPNTAIGDFADLAFQITGKGKRVELTEETITYYYDGSPITLNISKPTIVEQDEIAPNDTMVRVDSALYGGSDKAIETIGNHKTIMFENRPGYPWTGGRDIVLTEGMTGVLDWGKKQ